MATIIEDYVSFETAKLLKEKGFDGDTASCYILEDSTHHIMSDKVVQSEYYESQDSNEHGHLIQAPTLQMAIKWLREEYKIMITIIPQEVNVGVDRMCYAIYRITEDLYQPLYNGKVGNLVDSYEEAVEAAIKYCLENLI